MTDSVGEQSERIKRIYGKLAPKYQEDFDRYYPGYHEYRLGKVRESWIL